MVFTWLNLAIVAGLVMGALFAALPIVMSALVAPKAKGGALNEPYECGLPTFGRTWVRFGINYSIYALLFLSFEVAVLYLFPMAVYFSRSADWITLIKLVAFLLIPGAACAFFIQKKVFTWPRKIK